MDSLRGLKQIVMDAELSRVKTQPRMHTAPCKNCPSAHHPPDPEVEEIMTWTHEQKLETAFACGWNQKRYCKGYCDQMGISNDDLKTLKDV